MRQPIKVSLDADGQLDSVATGPNGYRAHFRHGLEHRLDGPSSTTSLGITRYCVMGINLRSGSSLKQCVAEAKINGIDLDSESAGEFIKRFAGYLPS